MKPHRLIPWVISLGLLLLFLARHHRAWTILVPAAIVMAVGGLFKRFMWAQSVELEVLSVQILLYLGGLCSCWFVMDRLRFHRIAYRWIVSWLLLTAFGLLCFLYERDARLPFYVPLIIFQVMPVAFICGSALAMRRTRNQFSMGRYLRSSLFWMLVVNLVVFLMFSIIIIVLNFKYYPGIGIIMRILFTITIAGTIFAVAAWLFVLPFVVYAFKSREFRPIFFAFMGVNNPDVAVSVDPAEPRAPGVGEQVGEL